MSSSLLSTILARINHCDMRPPRELHRASFLNPRIPFVIAHSDFSVTFEGSRPHIAIPNSAVARIDLQKLENINKLVN